MKIINTLKTKTGEILSSLERLVKGNRKSKGLFENPFFYFGVLAVILFGAIYFSCVSFASSNGFESQDILALNYNPPENNPDCFFKKGDTIPLETPDLKIIQGNTLGGLCTPLVLSPKVLGDVFGTESQPQKSISEYVVQAGDTAQSIADANNISVNTLLLANDLAKASQIKVGQTLTILPTDGILYAVKSGDTVSEIAKKYKSSADDIIAFNNLSSENDIFVGDILMLPGGVIPKKQSSSSGSNAPIIQRNWAPVADGYFILPAEGYISQGLHFYNAMDVAASCGNAINAAASGVVEHVKYGWNLGGGNYITIRHPNGVVSYYGHFMAAFVKPGDSVVVGQRIGLIGRTGKATGCHVHFDIYGAANPLAKYPVGTKLHY